MHPPAGMLSKVKTKGGPRRMTFSTIARLVLPLAAAAVLTACAPRPEDVAQVPQDVAGYGPVEDGDITVPAVDPRRCCLMVVQSVRRGRHWRGVLVSMRWMRMTVTGW